MVFFVAFWIKAHDFFKDVSSAILYKWIGMKFCFDSFLPFLFRLLSS